MLQTTENNELKRAIEFALSDGEDMLWAERRRYAMDGNVWVVLIGGVLLLGLSAVLTALALSPAPPDACNIYTAGLSFMAALGCLLCVIYAIKGNRNTIYALTQRRALIVQLLPIGKPVVYAVPVAQDMVHRLFPHPDGSLDYYMMELPMGRYGMREHGFLRVHDNDELQAALTRCGVKLPEIGERRPVRQRLNIYDGLSPLLPMLGWLSLLALMLVAAGQQLLSHSTITYLDLWLNGEHSTATVIAYCHKTTHKTTKINGEEQSSEVEVVYYPVYLITHADGTTAAHTELDGSTKPKVRPGEQVTVYYAPELPWRAMRRDFDKLLMPLFFLGIGGWCFYMFLRACGRYRSTRHRRYYLIAPEAVNE